VPPYEVDECAASLYLLLSMMATPSEELARRWAEGLTPNPNPPILIVPQGVPPYEVDEGAASPYLLLPMMVTLNPNPSS